MYDILDKLICIECVNMNGTRSPRAMHDRTNASLHITSIYYSKDTHHMHAVRKACGTCARIHGGHFACKIADTNSQHVRLTLCQLASQPATTPEVMFGIHFRSTPYNGTGTWAQATELRADCEALRSAMRRWKVCRIVRSWEKKWGWISSASLRLPAHPFQATVLRVTPKVWYENAQRGFYMCVSLLKGSVDTALETQQYIHTNR